MFYEYEAKNDSVRFCTKEEWESYIYDEYYQYDDSETPNDYSYNDGEEQNDQQTLDCVKAPEDYPIDIYVYESEENCSFGTNCINGDECDYKGNI